MARFMTALGDCYLKKVSGAQFICNSQCSGTELVRKHLDQEAANVSWPQHFLHATVQYVCMTTLDHYALFIDIKGYNGFHGLR